MARKNALLDVLGDAYVRGMARNVNALAEIAGKPFPDPRVYARGAEFVPGVGDAVGFGQDVRGYVENPSSLTPWAALGSLAALAPAVPNRFSPPGEVVEKIRKAAGGDNDAYLEIRRIVDGIDSRESMERAKPYLRALFPDYTEVDVPDYRNDFMAGIWRMVHRGDEIGRVPTSDLSKRIRAAASGQP